MISWNMVIFLFEFCYVKYFNNLLYPKGMFFEDVAFIPKLLLKADKIVKIDDPLYYYRYNEKGTTNVINFTNYDLYTATNMLEEDFYNNGYKDEIEYLYINGILVDLLIKIIKSKDPKKQEKFEKIRKEIIDKYPKWYKNKYIKRFKITKRLYLYCLKKNYYKIINKVFSR